MGRGKEEEGTPPAPSLSPPAPAPPEAGGRRLLAHRPSPCRGGAPPPRGVGLCRRAEAVPALEVLLEGGQVMYFTYCFECEFAYSLRELEVSGAKDICGLETEARISFPPTIHMHNFWLQFLRNFSSMGPFRGCILQEQMAPAWVPAGSPVLQQTCSSASSSLPRTTGPARSCSSLGFPWGHSMLQASACLQCGVLHGLQV
ncbi:uncharacterized protein LOC136012696 [Lathamus discolor]|uniref:uncharacterized protein LOC136012696 n=1 Tax=Lathamus discolor TaxID=678569 RepID=UPI0032B7F1FA